MSNTLEPPVCSCCKTDRESKMHKPREMIAISVEGNSSPYYLCGYCEGDATVLAKKQEASK